MPPDHRPKHPREQSTWRSCPRSSPLGTAFEPMLALICGPTYLAFSNRASASKTRSSLRSISSIRISSLPVRESI
jgi:hypothetical protein